MLKDDVIDARHALPSGSERNAPAHELTRLLPSHAQLSHWAHEVAVIARRAGDITLRNLIEAGHLSALWARAAWGALHHPGTRASIAIRSMSERWLHAPSVHHVLIGLVCLFVLRRLTGRRPTRLGRARSFAAGSSAPRRSGRGGYAAAGIAGAAAGAWAADALDSTSGAGTSLCDDGSIGYRPSAHGTGFDSNDAMTINPASGLPMVDGTCGVDVAGNPYGFDNTSSLSSLHDDSWAGSSTSLDDSWSSSSSSMDDSWSSASSSWD